MTDLEFRVSWKREGTQRRRKLYQTRWGADDYAAMLERLDEEPTDEDLDAGFGDVPKIVEGPTVEQRTVGKWRSCE